MILSDGERLNMLQPPSGVVRCVLDTDAFNEIDDQFAIAHLLLSPERFDVQAIYAAPFDNQRANSPEHGMELSHDEILRLLQRLGTRADGMVFKGVRGFVGEQKQALSAPAVDDLIARARAGSSADPLYVIAIAAISNIASALVKAPDIIDKIVVVWLGGHALEWAHTREFNLMQDVGGAQILLDSGVPLVLVPCLGVASHLISSMPEIERYVEPYGDIGQFLADRYRSYSDDHLGWGKEIWDMAPVAWLLNAAWCKSALVSTPILTDQMTWRIDPARPLMRYVQYLDRTPIMRDFFVKLRRRHEPDWVPPPPLPQEVWRIT